MFGTLKDTETSCEMVSTLCRDLFKKLSFLSKNLTFCSFWIIRFGSNFANRFFKYVSNNLWRNFRLPVSTFATVAQKIFNRKFTAKIAFPIGLFMLPLYWLWHWKFKVSPHIIWYVFGPHVWNLNKIVWNEIHKI